MADQNKQVSLDTKDELLERFDEVAVDMKEALKGCRVDLVRERERTKELEVDREQAVVSEAQIREDLENAQRQNQDLEKQIDDLRKSQEEKEHLLVQIQEQNEALEQKLTEAREDVEKTREKLDETKASKAAIEQDLKTARKRIEDLETQLALLEREGEEQRQALEHAEREGEVLQQQLEEMKRKIDALESDKTIITQERDRAEDRIKEIEVECQWELVRALSPVLTKLSSLADLEPESIRGLTSRSVFEKMKQWIEESIGERIKAFPEQKNLDAGLFLDPDRDGWEHLLEHYDWSPERPFEGLPEGERLREFRVLQRGWRANTRILIRARVAPIKEVTKASKQSSDEV